MKTIIQDNLFEEPLSDLELINALKYIEDRRCGIKTLKITILSNNEIEFSKSPKFIAFETIDRKELLRRANYESEL